MIEPLIAKLANQNKLGYILVTAVENSAWVPWLSPLLFICWFDMVCLVVLLIITFKLERWLLTCEKQSFCMVKLSMMTFLAFAFCLPQKCPREKFTLQKMMHNIDGCFENTVNNKVNCFLFSSCYLDKQDKMLIQWRCKIFSRSQILNRQWYGRVPFLLHSET